MKKVLSISLLIILITMVIKYVISNYDIEYNVSDYTIRETYKKGYYYFEIKFDKTYNFDLITERKLNKKLIDDISIIKSEDYTCLYPHIKNEKTYPICYKGKELISYYLINDDILNEFVNKLNIKYENKESKKSFEFFNNLNETEFIAIYKYNGFYILNGSKIKTISLFKNDRYDNSLCLQMNDHLLLPEESEYNFKNFILLHIKDGKKTIIKSDFEISFDSKMLGYINDKAYILDMKNNKQYEIDIDKKEVKEIGNTEKGYLVYKDNKLKTGMISELKKSKTLWIKEKDNSFYTYENSKYLYKNINKNRDLVERIYNKEVNIISSYKNTLYFTDNYMLYSYNPLYGIKKILVNEEWNFNDSNVIFVYNNN